jgi:hypothetical protein
MFLAAFRSRSCTVPHAAHVQVRTPSGLGPSLVPQAEHTWLVGSNRPVPPGQQPHRGVLPQAATGIPRTGPALLAGERLWSGSYLAGSAGRAPIPVLRQHIEQQDRPA